MPIHFVHYVQFFIFKQPDAGHNVTGLCVFLSGRMSITKIHAREILDSRGNPTVEVDLWTAKGKAWDTQDAHAHMMQTLNLFLLSQVFSEQQSPVERPQVSMKLLNSATETRAATLAKVKDKWEIS